MPLGDLEDEVMAKVLIVSQDQVLIENLKREMPFGCSFSVAVAASGFDAGIQAESFHPDAVVVDFSIGQSEAMQICQNLRRNPVFAEVIIVGLAVTTLSIDIVTTLDEVFTKPFDAALLAERLRTLIGAKKELV